MNWPGIDVISNRIAELPPHLVKGALMVALCQAEREGDEEWHENLVCSFRGMLC